MKGLFSPSCSLNASISAEPTPRFPGPSRVVTGSPGKARSTTNMSNDADSNINKLVPSRFKRYPVTTLPLVFGLTKFGQVTSRRNYPKYASPICGVPSPSNQIPFTVVL